MKIVDLSQDEVKKIVAALEADGFSNVQSHEHYISFKKYPREYEMYGLNLTGNFNNLEDDDSINIIFQEKEFFESKKNTEMSSRVSQARELDMSELLKTRHSTSIEQQSAQKELEESLDYILGWKLISMMDLKDQNKYYTEFESTFLAHIQIKGKDHFVLNNGENSSYMVYEGHPDLLISILTESPDNFFDAPVLKDAINDIKLNHNDL